MRKVFLGFCFLALLPALAPGQDAGQKVSSRGYGFVAPGAAIGCCGVTGFLHFGAGADATLYKGIGMGAEIGYLAPIHYFSQGVGMLSINGLYRFEKPGAKITPFFTGGYSLLFRSGHLNAINFGGGIDYWLGKKLGLRFEMRDNVSPSYFSDHLLQGRIGIVYR